MVILRYYNGKVLVFYLDYQRNYNITILKKERMTNAKMSVETSRLTFLSYKDWQNLEFMAFGTFFAKSIITTRVYIP